MSLLRAPEPVLMVIADVSGYTRYLLGTELDHAQDVLTDLLDTISSSIDPPLTLLAVEGDACFAFAPRDVVSGQALLDLLDACYFSFRRRLRDIGQATSCRCNACTRIPDLDLKFVAHVGEAVRQRVGRQETLAGPDVIATHRLLKNGIAEVLGHRGYAFFSDACARALGLLCRDMGMRPHAEQTDVGLVTGHVSDLTERWHVSEAAEDRRLRPDQVLDSYEVDLAASPPVVWSWLTDPTLRPRWQAGDPRITQERAAGRVEPGTVNHCIHGPAAMVEHILQWRPFQDVVVTTHLPGAFDLRFSYELEPNAAGTHVTMRLGGLDDPAAVDLWRSHVGPEVMAAIRLGGERLVSILAEAADADPRRAVDSVGVRSSES